MKKYFSLLGLIILAGTLTLSAQDVDKILENYFEVIGQDKVSDIKTIVSKGKAMQMGMEFPIVLYQKRPGMMRMEAEIQGTKMVQAYNGESGWAIMPWTGSMEPQDMGEDQNKSLEQMADMDGDLYNWKEKGFDLTLVGEEDMEGTPVYKLKLVKPDGDEFLYYIDSENYVVLRVDSKVNVQGAEVESSSYYSNFKPVEGMIMAHSIESRMGDQVTMQIVLESFEIDTELDNSLFEKPSSSEQGGEE